MIDRFLDEANLRQGRVIPPWKYYLAFFLTFWSGWAIAEVVNLFGILWALIPVLVGSVAYPSLLSDYKKRTLR